MDPGTTSFLQDCYMNIWEAEYFIQVKVKYEGKESFQN